MNHLMMQEMLLTIILISKVLRIQWLNLVKQNQWFNQHITLRDLTPMLLQEEVVET